ncbi:MAG TPA: TonB-dependent receptor [Puia sp.]|nr:TonB-dependent receptor [Puia sp.]
MILLLTRVTAQSQALLKGRITDAQTHQPLAGITVQLLPGKTTGISDQLGNFSFRGLKMEPSGITFSSVGYGIKTISYNELRQAGYQVTLTGQSVELTNVTISAHAGEQYKPISCTDIALRGVNNSQEVLRIIPGIVIGQHQGGGKAEQIFLRGFDCDHGTDIRLEADGMPINMVSHAHGQGYADSHFIIPETIASVDFNKGPYTAAKGDFATTGFADYHTRDALPYDLVKVEGGMFNTWRGLGMFNLLGEKARQKEQSWYIASEYRYSDSYFDNPQHFKRFNLFTKYNGKLPGHNFLTVSATTFWSKWNASGQIPDRAVSEHLIGFYGALDPYEGGITYRTNVNAQLLTSLGNGDVIKNQVYYSNYHFDLHTDFTFYLVDTVNGDEIRQREARDMMGYNGSYQHIGYLGKTKLTAEGGFQVRLDKTNNTELSHTVDRYTLLGRIKLGDISELSLSPYLSETIDFSSKFSMTAGLRFDQFYHTYNNKLASDTTLSGIGIYKAHANTLSPKLNFYYHAGKDLQIYLTTGRGFHSNDTRAVVVEHGVQVLPAAYSADLGAVFKPAPNLLINAAIWQIYLAQEFVYGGDGGTVDFNGKTRRYGFDFSGRYEPLKALYVDLDLNYAHGRALEAQKGQNYIPLAPIWTSSAGITYAAKKGFNGSLRYRYLADRPANEDYSLTVTGYFITDAMVNYTRGNYEIGLVVNNIFNTKWKETQFATETRLKGEAHSVNEICFTPGTPFAAKLSFALRF